MNSNNKNQELISAYLVKHPFLQEIGQLPAAIDCILAEVHVDDFVLPEITGQLEDFKKGIPVLQHADIQAAIGKPVEIVLRELVKGLLTVEIPDALKGFCRSLDEYLAQNAATEMIGYVLCQESESIQSFSEKQGLNEKTVSYLVWHAVSCVVSPLVKQVGEWQQAENQENAWERNYCPVCGSLPSMAQLKKKNQGRERHLVCGNCSASWHYKRIGCINCGNEDLKKMSILEIEAEPEMRLDVCDECHHYIKTYVNEGKEAVYLADWTTLHLDMQAQTEGLEKKGNNSLL